MSTNIHTESKMYIVIYTKRLISTKCIQKSSTYNSSNNYTKKDHLKGKYLKCTILGPQILYKIYINFKLYNRV